MFKTRNYQKIVPEKNDLELSSYSYELADTFIAKRPEQNRHEAKLLIYDQNTDTVSFDRINNITNYLPQNSTLVFNQSKVFPSRIFVRKQSGGKGEIFLLTPTPNSDGHYLALVKYRGKKEDGDELLVMQGEISVGSARVEKRSDEDESVFLVSFDLPKDPLEYAKLPIPPYIRDGVADEKDLLDYQTTYASVLGSVAAPTAGLHFSSELRSKLKAQGHTEAFVTLHVGLGTFRPVTSSNILEHHMHKESYMIDQDNFQKINNANFRVAVGTTTLRSLESALHLSDMPSEKFIGKYFDTSIFLYPGIEVKSIDALLTNFHLPESTLLMLVSSIVGRVKALELYEMAKKENFRFFSYGDAMLIIRKQQ